MKNQINLLLTLAMVIIGFTASPVVGVEPPHPYHVSLAEVNWNAKSQKFEVALCLWPADLEKALARQTGRSVDLAKEADIDRLMASYIAKRFSIVSTSQATRPNQTQDSSSTGQDGSDATTKMENQSPELKWHGHEANAKEVWLYFEITGASKASWTLENRIFFELNDDQLNHIQWNGTGKTETLVCNTDNAKINLVKK